MQTVSSREFNQDSSRVKGLSDTEPVFITDRGTPAYVILSIKEYQRITSSGSVDIVEMLRLSEDIDFEPPRLVESFKVPDFS